MKYFNHNTILDQEWLLNIEKIKLQAHAEQKYKLNQLKNRKGVINKKHNLVRR